MNAATLACAPPTLSTDMYSGCGCVSRRALGEHSEFPGQWRTDTGLCTARAVWWETIMHGSSRAGRRQLRLATLLLWSRREQSFGGVDCAL